MSQTTTSANNNTTLIDWVERVAELTKPAAVHWCDGSQRSSTSVRDLVEGAHSSGSRTSCGPTPTWPAPIPADVARVEDRTFICTGAEQDAGPTNNWRTRPDADELNELFAGAMRGRHVRGALPLDGPDRVPDAHVGVQLTDSPTSRCRCGA